MNKSVDTISIDIPSKSDYVMPLRLMCASLAARSGLNIEEVEDVKIALTEATNLCLGHVKNEPIHVTINVKPAAISVLMKAKSNFKQKNDDNIEKELCLHLIEATTSNCNIKEESEELCISFTKEIEN